MKIHYVIYVDTLDTSHKISNAFNAMYVDAVNAIHIQTFLSIIFLIFNQFSIQLTFWKADTEGFSTIPPNGMYVDTVNTSQDF